MAATATASLSLLRNCAALITARPFRPLVRVANHNFANLILPLQCRRLPKVLQDRNVSGSGDSSKEKKTLKCRLSFSTGATNNEEAAAKAAAFNADSGAPTIFDKIINKEIPSSIIYEDEKVLAFRDINPQAPVHVLVIPKFRDGLTQLGKGEVELSGKFYFSQNGGSILPTPLKAEVRHEEILGQLLYAAKIVAEKERILDGFRVVINNGPAACQSVYHLHLHVLGGRQMNWPPG